MMNGHINRSMAHFSLRSHRVNTLSFVIYILWLDLLEIVDPIICVIFSRNLLFFFFFEMRIVGNSIRLLIISGPQTGSFISHLFQRACA